MTREGILEAASRAAWSKHEEKLASIGLAFEDLKAFLWDPETALPDLQRKVAEHAKDHP